MPAILVIPNFARLDRGFDFRAVTVSTRPSIGRHDPLHPPAVAAVEPFLCQVLGERVSDI